MGCPFKQSGGLYPRLHIGAVLLAGGQGRRMGGVAKPLIRLQGVPLISRFLVALSGAGVDEVAVVTGHARDAVEEQLQSFPVTLAHSDGREDPVRVGMAALNGNFDAVFVLFSDQPLIGAGDLTELIAAFKKRPAGHVVVPLVDAQRGNPVLLDAVALSRVLAGTLDALRLDPGAYEPEFVHEHETDNTRFITDLNTIEDVQALAQRTGWRLELPESEAVL